MSRRHALLHLGPGLLIEDLGSANGTRLGGAPLAAGVPTPLGTGQVVELGESMIIVQRRADAARPRRLWSHDYFESRLENECARADESGGRFAVARVDVDPAIAAEPVRAALAELVRPADIIGAYGPGVYELLLVDSDRGEAGRRAQLIAAALGRVAPGARVALACYPEDGRSADALIEWAGGARPGAGDAAADPRAIVVVDDAVRALHRTVQRVAAGTLSVLLLGETGAGKEVLAETVHRLSPRRDEAFLRLNCAALSEQLLESELFGHEKGAFTGAAAAKPGLLETADRGTVFLDEIGELPMSTQV
jgi:hypothetical protein